MGTGICSILLYNLPYQFNGLHIIADVVFVLNIVLFLAFLLLSL
jgi:tellurite resistance protein TehA-like permease